MRSTGAVWVLSRNVTDLDHHLNRGWNWLHVHTIDEAFESIRRRFGNRPNDNRLDGWVEVRCADAPPATTRGLGNINIGLPRFCGIGRRYTAPITRSCTRTRISLVSGNRVDGKPSRAEEVDKRTHPSSTNIVVVGCDPFGVGAKPITDAIVA